MMCQWNWCFPSMVSMAKWQHSCRMGVWKGDSICLQTPNHQEHYLNSFPTDTCSVEPLKIALLLGNCRGLYYLLASCVLGMIRIRAIPVNQSSKSPRRLQQRRNGVDSAMASHLAEKERRLQEAWRVVAGEGRRRRESVRTTKIHLGKSHLLSSVLSTTFNQFKNCKTLGFIIELATLASIKSLWVPPLQAQRQLTLELRQIETEERSNQDCWAVCWAARVKQSESRLWLVHDF